MLNSELPRNCNFVRVPRLLLTGSEKVEDRFYPVFMDHSLQSCLVQLCRTIKLFFHNSMDVAEQLQDTAIDANCSCGNTGHEGKGYRRLADELPSPRSEDVWLNHVRNRFLAELGPFYLIFMAEIFQLL